MRTIFYFILLFALFLLSGVEGYGQATYTTSGKCLPTQADYFTSAICWDRTGTCTPQGGFSKKNTFPIPPAPALPVGTTITITEGEYDDVDEEGDSIKVMKKDYIITAAGDIIDLDVGETYTVALGDRLVKHGGTELIAETPGVAPDPIFDLQGTAACSVIIEINHPIYAGNINLKAHVTLKVNPGGKLDINHLTQDREITSSIIVNGGEVNIRGSFIPTAARNNVTVKTKTNITLLNGGKFNVEGLIDVKNNTHIVIDGDGTSNVVTRNISFNQGVVLDIKANGGLVVMGDTRFNGNDSKFNIEGYFETKSLTVAGGRGLELNTIGNAKVKIHEDVAIRGDATKITFGGKSTIEVGGNFEVSGGATTNFEGEAKIDIEGDVIVNGNSKLNITGQAEVYVCGARPPANAGAGVDVNLYCEDAEDGEACATYQSACRILPVNFIDISVEHKQTQRFNILSWSTSKEWENSHYEIERSIDGTKSFSMIGQVSGMGWTDEITEYSYEDDKLPLSGGNLFYRLKQVDFNGKFEYSDITAVRVPNVHFTKGVWRAYPNPNDGSGFNLELVDISQYHDEAISMRILSSNISSEEMSFRNLQELNQSASAMMANAPKGLWIFEIQWGNKVERIKVMKK